MALNETATREVLDVMDTYVQYYNQKNIDNVLSLFTKDISGFGTAQEEIINGYSTLREQLKRDFNPANAIRMRVKTIATGGTMPVAWITAFCTMEGMIGGKPAQLNCRMTAVLANHGGRWLFEQIHFSVPDAA